VTKYPHSSLKIWQLGCNES